MGLGGQRHSQATLPTGREPGTHCAGTWLGPRACLDECENLVSTGFDPLTAQPVASRCT
jgi:hypothetical protein